MDVTDLRRSATGFALDRDDLDDDPIAQFEGWFRYACETVPMDPNAVILSTVDGENRPSSRTVLLKSFDDNGFVFYTNYGSKKAADIEANPNVSLLFFWSEAARQVKINGTAERIPTSESGYRTSRASSPRAHCSRTSSRRSGRSSRIRKCPCPLSGEATASCLTRSSSGKGGEIVCTIAFSTPGRQTTAGRSSDWRPSAAQFWGLGVHAYGSVIAGGRSTFSRSRMRISPGNGAGSK
jgi:pyridoxamine-phosphate oxidase